ncbi:hypothetical protein TrispH2_005601 [Trichoplax sp. H2]|nr:hypothetical protein TrispH2_005601 [Trichoplax sp. H2]|eukprot:RDD42523.1 hypothetical protein TrispH2_005601 [Trichoplax sp. H2]
MIGHKLYKAVISELFKDENFFTSNSIKDIQQLVLTDLTRKEVFYTACYGAITSRSHHAIHSLMSDLPKLLQLCMQSATDIQRLLKRITRTRQKVIAHYGRELLFRAIEYGQDAYILQLAIEGIRLSVDNYDLLWQSIKIFLYDHYLLTPSTIIYKLSPISAVINNIDYRRFHQFILRLSNEDFDANSTVETLQLYKLAKAISDLPITLPLDVSLDNCIVEIMFEVMKNADLSCPLFQDHQLQKRLDEIIYVLLDKLIHLIKDYHNINIRVNIGKNVFYQETLLHRAARYQNPAWIRLLLQAGADREVKDSGLIKPVHHADKWDRHQIPMRVHTDRQIHHAGEWARNWECRHLLRNLQSCPLPS